MGYRKDNLFKWEVSVFTARAEREAESEARGRKVGRGLRLSYNDWYYQLDRI